MSQAPDKGTEIDTPFGNYYGSFAVCRIDGKPYACVEDYDGQTWRPISEELYKVVKRDYGGRKLRNG